MTNYSTINLPMFLHRSIWYKNRLPIKQLSGIYFINIYNESIQQGFHQFTEFKYGV